MILLLSILFCCRHYYDRLNRVIKTKDPEGNYTYYDYDANGNRTAVRDPRSSGPDDDTYKTTYTYDDNDRLTTITYPDGTYETTVYDAVGNMTSKTDRKGQTTTYTFDNANRLTTITYDDETTTQYTHDAAGRILSTTHPDGSTTYTKSMGNVNREYKLDSGGNIVYDYYTQYDDDGRMAKFFDATDSTQATLPAVFNKVKYNESFNKIGYSSNATLGQNFKYGKTTGDNRKYRQMQDSEARTAKFGTMKFGTSPIKYTDEAGPGAILATSYNYDDNGILHSITDPFGKDYSFQTLEKGSRTLYPNNTYTDRTYDEWGRLEAITHQRKNPADGSTTTLQSFTYQYDDNGNITKITEASGEYTDYAYQKDWFPMDSGSTENLNGIWGAASDDIFAVGDNGTILHYDGSSWSSMTSGTTENLNAIHGVSGSSILAAGDNGTILHYDGSSWTSMTSGTTENLLSVFYLSSYYACAVGENGTVTAYRNSTWTPETSGTTERLRAVWRDGTVYAAGDNGTIIQNWGQGWYSMESGTQKDLYSFRQTESGNLHVVGENGTMLEYASHNWVPVESDASWDYSAIWGISDYPDNKYFIAGFNAPVMQYDEEDWNLTAASGGINIKSLWGISENDVIAAGSDGTIIRYQSPPTTGTINRLLTETRRTETGKIIYNIEYLFDNNQSKNGNIHKVIYDGNNVTEFNYNEMNELTGITHPDSSTETLTYDNNGNLTQTTKNSETTSYQWDCHDRLIKVTLPPSNGAEAGEGVNFTYNGEDELIKIDYPDITVDMQESKGDFVRRTAKFKFNKQETPTETEASSYNIFVDGQLLCKYGNTPDAASTSRNSGKNTGEPLYYHYDNNDNLALTTDQYGNIVEKPLIDAYGNNLPLSNSSCLSSGKTLSSNLLTGGAGVFFIHRVKLYNMRRRYFSKNRYRFISPDPSISDYIDYLYAYHNPIIYSDPSGLMTINRHGRFPTFARKLNGTPTNVLEVMRIAVQTVKTRLEKALKNGSKDACFCAFKKYCKKAQTDTRVKNALQAFITTYDISFHYETKRTVKKIIDFLAYTRGFNMFIGHLLLGGSISNIASVIIHEMGHHKIWCNIPGNKLITMPAIPGKPPKKRNTVFFKEHACCDLISLKCGFNEQFGKEYEENMKMLWPQLYEKYKQEWNFPKWGKKIEKEIKDLVNIKAFNWTVYGYSKNSTTLVEDHCKNKMIKE